MAPVDRHERRQQRVRGAGASSVQSSFGFNFGALAVRPAKQPSLPPQLSSRRTPLRSTPRGPPSSAKRHRSASLQRSSGKKQRGTPRERTVTPQTGKRKRGSQHARANEDDGEPDDLSPDRDEHVRSIEKSRRVAAPASPVREENLDDVPDELSFDRDVMSSGQRSGRGGTAELTQQTPVPAPKTRLSVVNGAAQSPVDGVIGSASARSRQGAAPTPGLVETGPTTPALPSSKRPSRLSSSRLSLNTPSGAGELDESEDELSPPQPSATTTRVVDRDSSRSPEGNLEVDELSSPANVATNENTPQSATAAQKDQTVSPQNEPTPVPKPSSRGRPRRIVEDEEDVVQSTPASNQPRRLKKTSPGGEQSSEEAVDELSPEGARAGAQPTKHVTEVASNHEASEEEQEQEDPSPDPTPRPAVSSQPRIPKDPGVKSSHKRRKVDPQDKQPRVAISIMRLEGSKIRGITVADTTRSLLEEGLQQRIDRMGEKISNAQNPARRKEMKRRAMLALSFKESVSEKLLDLQDANDTITVGLRKLKAFKNNNVGLRRDILACQNNRQEIAIELDEVQAEFEAEKKRVEAKHQLSSNMFDIQAAIQEGKARARAHGREDEGPDIPLSMLLDNVARDIGSAGGGLLVNIKTFNGMLERAAGWLEGRA